MANRRGAVLAFCVKCPRAFFKLSPRARFCPQCRRAYGVRRRRELSLTLATPIAEAIPDDDFLPRFAQRPRTLTVADPGPPDDPRAVVGPGSAYRRALRLERRVALLARLLADRDRELTQTLADALADAMAEFGRSRA